MTRRRSCWRRLPKSVSGKAVPRNVRLEVCVDSIDGAEAAVRGGADRIELCAALSEGGLTPSPGLMHAASQLSVPIYAMIRPRGGGFQFSPAEVGIMERDIDAARGAGLAGVVLGAEGANAELDIDVLARLIAISGPLGCTLHRVVDIVDDPLLALDQAIDLGFERILTSGGAATADEGAGTIAAMIARAKGRISVMPGGGISPGTAADIVTNTGARELHASCSVPATANGSVQLLGAAPRRETSEDIVRQMVKVLGA